MSRYDQNHAIYKRIEQQTEAEFAFARSLEDHGIDCKRLMRRWGLTLHQFNVLAHTLDGVQDEAVVLHPQLFDTIADNNTDPARFFQRIAENLARADPAARDDLSPVP